jgi:hypothetical protein
MPEVKRRAVVVVEKRAEVADRGAQIFEKYRGYLKILSYHVTDVSTSQSSLNLWPPGSFFRPGNRW